MQEKQNAVNLQHRVNNLSVDHDGRMRWYSENQVARVVHHQELSTDRMWNVDEVAELVAKTPVFLDAIAGAVASGVAQALAARETTTPK